MSKDEYDWEKCKQKIREVRVQKEKEKREENDTKYGEYEEEKYSEEESNESNWMITIGNIHSFDRKSSWNLNHDFRC